MDVTTNPSNQNNTVQVGWRIPVDLAKEVRKAAIDLGITAQDFAAQVLRAHLEQNKTA